MSLSHRHRDHSPLVDDFSPHAAVRARISTQRADRLREFILGHLPDDVTVDVVISAGVQTAAVLPADVEAIVSSDATEIERSQAEQFLAGVDADYLVLVTGNEADLTRIPLNDQLTADHAHQFGLAFHELLHILKTAITAIAELLDAEIDEQYHAQVHDLINIIEDGAIESEAIHGGNFSDNAGIRLELTRRLHSQTPDDIPDGQEVRYSFWDAVTSCLYDEAIYPTGITAVLLDEEDPRIRFKTDADRDAFEAIHSELCILVSDALAIRSADRADTTHAHDKTASIRRARRVIETWTDHIQPILEANTDANQDDTTAEQQQGADEHSVNQQASGDGEDEHLDLEQGTSNPGDKGGIPSGNDGPESEDTDKATEATQATGVPVLPGNFDPSDISLSREATDDPHQNIFEQPQVTPDPNPDDVDDNERDQDPSGESEGNKETETNHDDGDSDTNTRDSPQAAEDGPVDEKIGEDASTTADTQREAQSRAEAIARATERARQREHSSSPAEGPETASPHDPTPGSITGDTPQSAVSSSITDRSRDNQLSLGDFDTSGEDPAEADSEATELGVEATPESEGEREDGNEDQHEDQSGDGSTGTSDIEPGGGNDSRETSGGRAHHSEESLQRDHPQGPAHAQSSSRSADESQAAYDKALASDERAAHDEADRERIDERALGDELDALGNHFERQRRQGQRNDQEGEENSGHGGNDGYSPGTLEDLTILPLSDNLVPPREWGTIEDGAGRVADTLELYLRLDRRRSTRRGLSAGAYDTRAGHRLAIGDPRVCKSRTMGNEKQYALVFILDRSGSMRQGSPPKIEVATQALTRFALAAENLGIRVAVIDFIHGNARLVKPFSIEARHVQSALLDTSCGGGTPLADAIGLANDLVEAQRDEPLIISVGDDQTSTDAVTDAIRQAYAPVCSLTIATDTEPGSLSGSASELATVYERQETVYTPERLDDRLDQFASLLAGL
ncbi:VWA domain-containing protein [Haloglomus halophilum]|uniref:VWA domain-containing protein n=1 Tax=Haloglomus halophilum TaxID=2962672 RepID=UPI0020C9F3EE|nr:VWA domain-containing protein [Haloglomus halophilum]